MNRKSTRKELREAADTLPGAAVNSADKDKTSQQLIDERTCVLGNNPNNQKFNT